MGAKYMSCEDITFCTNQNCDEGSCIRNPKRIKRFWERHSFADLAYDPNICPKMWVENEMRQTGCYAAAADFMRRLRRHSGILTAQEFRTIKGQATHGDVDGACRGLDKLIQERS